MTSYLHLRHNTAVTLSLGEHVGSLRFISQKQQCYFNDIRNRNGMKSEQQKNSEKKNLIQ